MTTGSEHVAITNKRIMGLTDWRERFFDYMKSQIEEMNAQNFNTPSFIGYGATISADGTDRVKVVKNDSSSIACDSVGHFLDLNPTYVETTGLYFENQNTIVYYMHIKYETIPTDIQINPVSGQPEYVSYQDNIGLSGQPNSATDNGGTITFNVTNVTESGVSNAGRKCLVYMVNPNKGAINKTIGIEECTVQWSGGVNQITTAGTLGQATVSTTASDYKIILLGPRINRYIGATISEHVFVGTITGVGAGGTPTVFDHSNQKVTTQTWFDIFANGLDQHFLPKTDDTYDLGSSSYQWRDGYFDGTLNVDTLSVSISAGEGVVSDLIPTTDNNVSLGEVGRNWENLYISNTANIAFLHLSSSASYGATNSIVPTTDNTYDLGSLSYQWRNGYFNGTVFIDDLRVSNTSGEGVGNHLVPRIDDTYDLGSASYQWRDGYFDGTLNTDRIAIENSSAGGGVESNLGPTTDDTYDLGSSSVQWRNGYFDGTLNTDILVVSENPNEGVGSYLIPNSDDAHWLGTPTYKWANGYFDGTLSTDKLSVTSSAGEGVSSNLNPTTSNTYDLGNSTYYWGDIYANTLRYKTSPSTFDTYNDLDLIENYKPTSEVMKIQKAGKIYDVNKGDISTIPWPMLSKLDPEKGDYFLDLGDSTMFLVGAIKQLYQLHKKEINELKELINGKK
jgi:hypothetical protein